ncbi:MAG: dethiobiotin synthase [Firmicutes bacterium]|nr:dethiobiotin synthase [Bacillota bacterium]
MTKGYFITGTDTGVGKTVVTAGLMAGWRQRGIEAIAMKPVATGGVLVDGQLIAEDAQFYLKTGNLDLPQSDINCYCFQPAVSPHLAAALTGQQIQLSVIRQAFTRLTKQYQLVLVEGAGGLCVPLTGPEFTMADLAKDLGLPLIIVARPGLGTINHTVLTVKWAQHLGLTVKGIIINGCNPTGLDLMEQNNVAMITQMTGAPILGLLPQVDGLSVEKNNPVNLVEIINAHLNWHELLEP